MPAGDVSWVDRRALDRRGRLIGVVVDAYAPARPSHPGWLAIATGFFGTKVVVAPRAGAALRGDDVVLAHDHDTITRAPPISIVVSLEPADEQRLLEHYAVDRAVGGPDLTEPRQSRDPPEISTSPTTPGGTIHVRH